MRIARRCPLAAAWPGLALAWLAGIATSASGQALPPSAASVPEAGVVSLHIVGGLDGLNQYNRHEQPFWTVELPRFSAGRLKAEIVPFDRAGIRGQEMLRLMSLGVVPFGTAMLAQSVAEVPVAAAPDLAGLNPDIAALRRSLAAFRPFLEETLKKRYDIEVLAIYTYPAQVVFCKRPFNGLAGLAGRRIRVSSPTQSDLVQALGGKPVLAGFAEVMPQMRSGNLDCAITGTMSGNTIGLSQVTTHVHSMAVGWGLAVFGANGSAWQAIAPDLQAVLRRELLRMERSIWEESDRETGEGMACNTGDALCGNRPPGQMIEVRSTADDERRRREILAQSVLPRWIQRCGAACAEVWNRTIGPTVGIMARQR
jgi:TRAP-type C4-dicarboxylate transport system substrate-binding protein